MNRSEYDTDVTTFNPNGRLFQVEYAMEAVNQGSASVGLVSDKFAVIAGLKRSPFELASFQKKVFRVDEHMGIVISGLTADARSLAKYMRTESLNHKFVFGTPIPPGRLVADVADKHQECTQSYVRRPYGVGLLVAAYDRTGPHLFQTCPSGSYYEYKAQAIGARSQTSRTYLEKHFESFSGATKEELIRHALAALSGATETDKELNAKNTTVAIVGEGIPFTVYDEEEVAPFIEDLIASGAATAAVSGGAGGGAGGGGAGGGGAGASESKAADATDDS